MSTPKKVPRRQRCRICSALAGMTRDICDHCRMADVRKHLKQRGNRKETVDELHAAYSQSKAVLPDVAKQPMPVAMGTNVAMRGVQVGSNRLYISTVAHASRFSAMLGGIPTSQPAAQVYFSLNQKEFYRRMRSIMKHLDGTALLPKRIRKTPTKKGVTVAAASSHNIALSRALRFLRIYMQMEIIPLALKMDCSKTSIWHIECCDVVIQPHWLERYANAFDVTEQNILKYAAALQIGPAARGEPRDMLKKFVRIVL